MIVGIIATIILLVYISFRSDAINGLFNNLNDVVDDKQKEKDREFDAEYKQKDPEKWLPY